MGLCILFPHLCGLKTVRVAEMKQILTNEMCALELTLSKTEDTAERMAVIEVAKANAIKALAAKGYNPYE